MKLLRKTAELLSRNRKIKRRLPNGVAMYLSPDSQLKYLAGQFDRDLVDLAKGFTKDSVVWDVGANCGVLAFSSKDARQVVAVEADPFLVSVMQQSATMNGSSVTIVSAAASSTAGLVEFSIAARGRASNHLTSVGGRSQTGGERSRILVPAFPLDDLLDVVLPPSFVKIDVEGAEVEVLKGATRLLNEIRPTIYLETVEETHQQCRVLLEAAGYTLVSGAEMNWLCTPQSKQGQ